MNPYAENSHGYNLRLYVAGQTLRSVAAISNLRKLCEKYLAGRYGLDVVDLIENPSLAQQDEIIAIPTLIRQLPEPIGRIIGDPSNSERVLMRLDIDCGTQSAVMTDGDQVHAAPRDYVLRLFVVGHSQGSLRAVRNVTRLCEEHLSGHFDLEIVDVYQQPEKALEHQFVAAPTLVKISPPPTRRMVGDMSDSGRVLAGLGLAWSSI
jgi:circadian clock protein KaiB